MPSESDFSALLARVCQGDRDALAQLLTEYEPALRRFARSHLGPTLRPYADSLDLVQSAHKSMMIALWSKNYEFTSPEKLLALARTILQRKVARLADRTQRQVRPGAGDDSSLGPLKTVPSTEPNPAVSAEFRDALERIGKQLNERERAILSLLLEGQTRKEIAESLGEDPHVFRVYWGRVMERLRDSGAVSAWLDSQ